MTISHTSSQDRDDELATKQGGLTGGVLKSAVERALRIQQPAVASYVAKIRRDQPSASPADVIATLDKLYLRAVGGAGAVAGGTAFIPGVGTVASLATATVEALAALDASVLYTLAVAEVHGLHIEDVERRRAVVLAIVLGDGGGKLMRKVTGGTGQWAGEVAEMVPLPKLGPVNQTLVRWFLRRWLTRQGALAFGRALPFGAGAVIGAVGNVAVAKGVIRSTVDAFGPPPEDWPASAPAALEN